MQTIVLVSSLETQNWKFFLNHHGLPYQEIDYWENSDNLFRSENSNIILDFSTITDLYHHRRDYLKHILQYNKIFLVGFSDASVMFRNDESLLLQIDALACSHNLVCILECDYFEHGLKNIQVVFDPVSKFFDLVEQRVSVRLEKNYQKDFLLTMGRQDTSRDMLWSKINNVTGHDSIMIYHKVNPSRDWSVYVGENSAPLVEIRSLVPSLDLYNSCCFEIAVETFAERISWYSEKLIRPIAARTPFVALGASGILQSLRNLGFKTFGSLIDESYDQTQNLSDRISQIVDVTQHIVDQGSENFARAAQDIVDYNWNRLAEIKGSFLLDKDRKYFDLLFIDRH